MAGTAVAVDVAVEVAVGGTEVEVVVGVSGPHVAVAGSDVHVAVGGTEVAVSVGVAVGIEYSTRNCGLCPPGH